MFNPSILSAAYLSGFATYGAMFSRYPWRIKSLVELCGHLLHLLQMSCFLFLNRENACSKENVLQQPELLAYIYTSEEISNVSRMLQREEIVVGADVGNGGQRNRLK